MPDSSQPDQQASAWWDESWSHRRKLVFDNVEQGEDLVDFPVLVLLDSDVIDYQLTGSQGQALRFVDPDQGGPLAHEIERWEADGKSIVWVKVPQIDASSSDDFIWMYYGNQDAPDGQQATAVWSNGYVAVWHMDGDPADGPDAIRDSTANGEHGTCLNMSSEDLVDAKIGKGLDFDGRNDVVRIDGSGAAGDPLDIVGGPMTISAWVYARGDGAGAIVAKRDDGDVQWYFLNDFGYFPPVFLFFSRSGRLNGFASWRSSEQVTPLSWQYSAVTVRSDGDPTSFYLDGSSSAAQVFDDEPAFPTHFNVEVSIGARWSNAPSTYYELDGIVDEVRVADVARSAGWMAAQQLSMDQRFVTFDVLESN